MLSGAIVVELFQYLLGNSRIRFPDTKLKNAIKSNRAKIAFCLRLPKWIGIDDFPVDELVVFAERRGGEWSCPCNSGHADTVRLMTPHYA